MKLGCLAGWALLGLLVVLLALAAGTALRGGVSARTEPPALEAALARRVRGWAIPAAARSAANPVPGTPEVLAEARAHFADHCASCHGNDGSGRTPMGRGLYPRPPDMRAPATQALSDGELFWIIENGVRLTGMPGWGGEGKPEQSWKLVRFIRHLPRVAPDELQEMERLNPRGPDEWKELEEEERFLEGSGEAASPPPSRHAH
jgi:mono/diheme cytochrome c family protein